MDNNVNANNDVNLILSELYDMLQHARGVPLSSDKCIVDRERALDLIDEAIASLPEDIKKAKTIVSACNEVVGQARKEAETTVAAAQAQANSTIDSANSEAQRINANAQAEANTIVERAKQQAEVLITQESIYMEAQKRCEEMIKQTNDQIDELKENSRRYMDEALKKAEDTLSGVLDDVKGTRTKLATLADENKPKAKSKPEKPKNSSYFMYMDID